MEYAALYADPAWKFRVRSRKGLSRSAENHYGTMPSGDIASLPVSQFAARNAALFMWTTWPHLPEALAVAQAWGFEYKTVAFVWVKLQPKSWQERLYKLLQPTLWHTPMLARMESLFFVGLGYWTRANTEPCLLFTRGSISRRKEATNVRQLIVSPLRRHSQKPDEAYERIEALVPGPYLELFARQQRLGWHCWGNEVASNISLELPA